MSRGAVVTQVYSSYANTCPKVPPWTLTEVIPEQAVPNCPTGLG